MWRHRLFEDDSAQGKVTVYLPDALDRKYLKAYREEVDIVWKSNLDAST